MTHRMLPAQTTLGVRRSRGYTVVEVMVALALLAVGGSGIIALQRVAVVGTLNTQHIVAAVNVASGTSARLQAEAASTWTGAAAAPIAGTQFEAGFTSQAWTLAEMTNVEGHVAGASPEPVAYVTYFRVTTIAPTVVRLEVRTIYAKHGRDIRLEGALAPAAIMAMLEDTTTTITVGGINRTRNEYGTSFITTAILRQP